jgi:hypothetical protein
VIGYLDGIDGHGVATGWACDPDSPWSSIGVTLYADGAITDGTMVQGGTLVGQGTANLGSEAAIYAQCGGGWAHRFSLQLSGFSAMRNVTAAGIDTTTGSSYVLQGWRCSESPSCTWSTANSYNPNGWVDGIDANGCMSGWSCDRDNHDVSIAINFYADGSTFVQSDTAGQGSEPAVNDACFGGYYHRFRTCLPSWTKGHALSVRGVDTVSGGETGVPCANQPTCNVTW